MPSSVSAFSDEAVWSWGVLAIAGGGTAVGFAVTASTMLPESRADIQRFIDDTLSPAGIALGVLGIVGLIALLFGITAIYVPLRSSRWAIVGLLFSVAAIGLLIATFGTSILGEQILVQLYRTGHEDTLSAFLPFSTSYSNGYVAAYNFTAIGAGLVGAVTNAIALVRTSAASVRTSLVFGLGFTLLALQFPIVTLFGGLLLCTAAGWLIRNA
jgi:hypothetical protein